MRKNNNFTTFKERQKNLLTPQRHDHGELFWYAHNLDRFLSLPITPLWQLLVM